MNKITEQLKNSLGLDIKKIKLLDEAMSHGSCEGRTNNKKLAFLGDAILQLVVSMHIFQKSPQLSVGEMTEKRASIVNSTFLSRNAKKWRLKRLLRLGKGEKLAGGEEKEAILAESVEALIGAIYLDYGYEKTKEFIVRNIIPEKIDIEDWNLKGKLQELALTKGLGLPEYSVIHVKGAGNKKLFLVNVKINGKTIGSGEGRNKKLAEEVAAKYALETLITEEKK